MLIVHIKIYFLKGSTTNWNGCMDKVSETKYQWKKKVGLIEYNYHIFGINQPYKNGDEM